MKEVVSEGARSDLREKQDSASNRRNRLLRAEMRIERDCCYSVWVRTDSRYLSWW